MCDMSHAILLLEGTLRSSFLLSISPETALIARACVAEPHRGGEEEDVRGRAGPADPVGLSFIPSPPTACDAGVGEGAAAVAVPAGRIDKSNKELSVPSMRRMDSGMSHLILKDGATFSYIRYLLILVLLTSSVAAAVAGLAAAAARARSSPYASVPSEGGFLEVLDGEHLRVVPRVQRLREGRIALALAAGVRHLVSPVTDTNLSRREFDKSEQSIGINRNGQSMSKPMHTAKKLF